MLTADWSCSAREPPFERSTTTTRRSLVMSSFWTKICTAMLLVIKMGMRNKVMRNARVRTEARYSRAAMTQILRMVAVLHLRRGDADEDVLERGPGQLEVSHLAVSHEPSQETLRVSIALEAQLLQPPVV